MRCRFEGARSLAFSSLSLHAYPIFPDAVSIFRRDDPTPMNVLVVEDNAVQGRIVKRCLSEHVDYEKLTAVRTAEDALQALHGNTSYDVLIVDWMLPGVSGIELVQTVRRRETFDPVYIIMQTAKDRAEHVEEALDAGADNYVIKPLDCDALGRKIARHHTS